LQLNDNEFIVLLPVELLNTVASTRFEEDLDILNSVYSMLFDGFVIAPKNLFCYWPNDSFADDGILRLN